MWRPIAFFILVLAFGRATGQQPVELITLPGLDSTQMVSLVERPGAGYLVVTRQAGSVDGGSTLITVDAGGGPLGAVRTDEVISRAVTCADSGFFLLSNGPTLIKADAALNVEWATRMVSPPLTWSAHEIAEMNGTYYLVGIVKSQLIDTFQLNYGTYAAALFKFNGNGELIDQVIIADTSHTSFQYNLYLPKIALGGDGSVYLGLDMLPGALAGTCNKQPTIVKLDADLEVQWSYRYTPSTYNGLRGLRVLRTGNLMLYGDHGSTLFSCNYFRPFLQVIDTAGTVLFAKNYRHADPLLSHGSGEPLLLPDSTLLFPQVHSTPFPFVNTRYFHHIDAQGNTISAKRFTHPDSTFSFSFRVAGDSTGSIGVCRMNAKDTLLFTTIDTSLTTLCYTEPDAVMDSTISITPIPFEPHYLEHAFHFVDTTYAFEPTAVASSPGCDLATLVTEPVGDDVIIFPNPSSGAVRITSAFPIHEITITDALGRVVHRSYPQSDQVSVALALEGMHIVRVRCDEREYMGRLVITAR